MNYEERSDADTQPEMKIAIDPADEPGPMERDEEGRRHGDDLTPPLMFSALLRVLNEQD